MNGVSDVGTMLSKALEKAVKAGYKEARRLSSGTWSPNKAGRYARSNGIDVSNDKINKRSGLFFSEWSYTVNGLEGEIVNADSKGYGEYLIFGTSKMKARPIHIKIERVAVRELERQLEKDIVLLLS